MALYKSIIIIIIIIIIIKSLRFLRAGYRSKNVVNPLGNSQLAPNLRI